MTFRREQVERELGDLSRHVDFRLEGEGDDLRVCVPGCGPGGAERRIPAEALLLMRRRLAQVLGAMANDPPAAGADPAPAWDALAVSGRSTEKDEGPCAPLGPTGWAPARRRRETLTPRPRRRARGPHTRARGHGRP